MAKELIKDYHESWYGVLKKHYCGMYVFIIFESGIHFNEKVEFTKTKRLKIGGRTIWRKDPIVFCSVSMNKGKNYVSLGGRRYD